MAASSMAAIAAAASMRAPPTLDGLLAARTVWHAGRMAIAGVEAEPTGHAALDALLPQGGWPPHALTELLLPADGIGELALLLPTLARLTQSGEAVALVAPPYVPYAPAWQSAGIDLSQLQVVDAAPRDALWAFEQCLRSGACAAVLGWPVTGDAQALRRLQVAADSGQCLAFALRDRRHAANASPAALRIEAVHLDDGVQWQVRKCRGGNVPAQAFVLPADMPMQPRHAGTAMATDAVARSGSTGNSANVEGIRAQARSRTPRLAPAPALPVGATPVAKASGTSQPARETANEGIRAQARSHMPRSELQAMPPRPWARRSHPHDPRTLFD